jgi:hypothetical protein
MLEALSQHMTETGSVEKATKQERTVVKGMTVEEKMALQC